MVIKKKFVTMHGLMNVKPTILCTLHMIGDDRTEKQFGIKTLF